MTRLGKTLMLVAVVLALEGFWHVSPVSAAADITAVRGTFFDLIADPWDYDPSHEMAAARFLPDGLLIIENGIIMDFGPYEMLKDKYADINITEYKDRIIVPGFIDAHVHFPQTRVLGAYGNALLEWLEMSVFPEEMKYNDPAYAREGAKHFFDDLLANGTTTAQVFTTVSPVCTEVLFEEAMSRNMLLIGGLTGMDRSGPKANLDTAEDFYEQSKRLIEKYHGKKRVFYAISPRFALGSTPGQLELAGKLWKEYPACWVNTHLAESPEEIRAVLNSFPDSATYLDVYEKYGLVGPKFSGGHSIWLNDESFRRLSKLGASVTFCPASNLFLGSGSFQIGKAKDPKAKVRMAMGSDVGGGNHLCMLNILGDAYKVGMMNCTILQGTNDPRARDIPEAERNKIGAYRGLYSITLGGAEALYLDDRLGNFNIDKEADFVILDPDAGPPQLAWHQSLYGGPGAPKNLSDCANKFFSLMVLGDDRAIDATYILGKLAYKKGTGTIPPAQQESAPGATPTKL